MTIGTFALEGTNVLPLGTRSIVGYLNGTAILPVLWLAIVPGIIGHQVYHYFLPCVLSRCHIVRSLRLPNSVHGYFPYLPNIRDRVSMVAMVGLQHWCACLPHAFQHPATDA